MAEDFFGQEQEEHKNFRMGSDLAPLDLHMTMIEIARLNVKSPIMKTVILSDGQELDINIYLETDREVLGREIKELINEDSDRPR